MKRVVPALLFVAFLPAWSSTVVPSHDTLQVFTAFWTYVSGLVTDGRLPEWMPLGRYGAPSGPILMYVTPVAYVTGALGAALHATFGFTDTLLLFKLTVALEYLLFATGLLRFGRLVLQTVWVQYFVVALGVLSSPWMLNIDFNFHVFYMTPWILASLTLAFQTGLPRHLGMAALLTVFASVGNVPYFPPFLLLQLTVFAMPLVWSYWHQARRLALHPHAWLWLGVAGALFAIHLVVLVRGMDGLAILSEGRDPVTNHVPKDVFLTHGGVTQPVRLLLEFLTGRITDGDNTYYLGLGSLVLLPLSLLIQSSPVLRAIQCLSLFLLLFSTGGLVASTSYYFPGMVYYRHISIVFGLLRVLVFLCIGCVLDQMIRDPAVFAGWRRRLPRGWRGVVGIGVVGLAAAELVRAHDQGPGYQLVFFSGVGDRFGIGPVIVRVLGYAALLLIVRSRVTRVSLPVLLMCGLLADMGTFWGWAWVQWPRLNGSQAAVMQQLTASRRLPNLGTRRSNEDVQAEGSDLRFLRRTPPLSLGELYVHTYLWIGVDPCVPQLRTDFIAQPVADLFARRGVPFSTDATTEERVLADPWLAHALACGSPRVTSDARLMAMDRGYDWMRLTVDNAQQTTVPVTVSEVVHPGWRALVDGRPAEVIPRNEAFLGVDVPAGRHQVEFRFHAPVAGPLRALEAALAALSAVWLLAHAMRYA